MKVYIITEGSNNIGFGHVTRCLSLCQAFEEKDVQPLMIINGDKTVESLITNSNYRIFNWLEKENELLKTVKNGDVIIIDSYLAEKSFYDKISRSGRIHVFLDDTTRIDYPKGIVVNGTVYAEEIGYPIKKDIQYLLGSQYIPIRKEFWNVPEKALKEKVEKVMITFGGDDAKNMTPAVLKHVNENLSELVKKIIIGTGFKNIKQIEAEKDDKTELIYCPDAEGMKQAMLDSDIAISAGGQTLYELARVGVPAMAIVVAENQMNNVRGWQKAGFIEYAGWWDDKHLPDMLIAGLRVLNNFHVRRNRSFKGREHVDGLGAKRIIEFSLSKVA